MIVSLDGVGTVGAKIVDARCGTRLVHRQWVAILGVMLCSCLAVCSAEESGMKYPLAAAVGGDGIVYVADRDLPGVWKYADNKWSVYFQGSK